MVTGRLSAILLIVSAALSLVPQAQAQDRLKVIIGQINNWENQAPALGQKNGIFKKYNLELELLGTQGSGETLQAIISGAGDIGIGVGTSGAMRAYSKGAPVRVIGAAFTGSGDLYWYVAKDSPIKTLKDAGEQNTIAFSSSGSSTNNVVLAFRDQLGVKARPTATGGPAATLTQVMSRQIDIGWSSPPFGLEEIQNGSIRIVGRGSDVASLEKQSPRVNIVNAGILTTRKGVIDRFIRAYSESLDWMYSGNEAAKLYAEAIKKPVPLVEQARDQYFPKAAMSTGRVSGLDAMMKDAIASKFLDKPLTDEQLKELFAAVQYDK